MDHRAERDVVIDQDAPTGESSPSERWALPPCPGCGARCYEAVSDGEGSSFFCHACGRCWHFELNWALRVDPASCLACPRRAECLAVYRADHPDVAPAC